MRGWPVQPHPALPVSTGLPVPLHMFSMKMEGNYGPPRCSVLVVLFIQYDYLYLPIRTEINALSHSDGDGGNSGLGEARR